MLRLYAVVAQEITTIATMYYIYVMYYATKLG